MKCIIFAAALFLSLAVSEATIAGTFSHGVASGDPLPDGIVLWTRVTPRILVTQLTPVHKWPSYNVTWTVYSDNSTTKPVLSGSFNSTKDIDYTVKVYVNGLKPATDYWYNFVLVNGTETSPTGHFRLPPTAGTALDSLKYAFFSCSNWPTGYFNAYDQASKYDLDFWIHLGDYYYEYGISDGSNDVRWEAPPLGVQPNGDIQSLDDYRKRHALYRKDAGLQALTASAALIAIWDDHEFMNNVWSGGAQNQYPGEVAYWERRSHALQAYVEWMPIRWNISATPAINVAANYAINRTFDFGNLATFFMLEDRVTQRTQAGQDSNEFDPTEITDPSVSTAAIIGNLAPSDWNSTIDEAMLQLQYNLNVKRTNKSDLMLGPGQIAWVQKETQRSAAAGTVWQLYCEGTVMQDWFNPDYEGALQQALAPNNAVHQYWQEVYDNLTVTPAAGAPNNTYQTFATNAASLPKYASTQNVTTSTLLSARNDVALGRYTINYDFDSWQGYLWDRYYFLGNISAANNPAVYSGDSHDFWTGYLTLVSPDEYVRNGSNVPTEPRAAIEFAGGSVTSDGNNGITTWPLDYVNAAFLAANPNMVHVEQRYKGFVYVQLTPTNQHVEQIYVSTIASMDYVGFCGAAFDVPARKNNTGEIVVNAGQCGAVPGATQPYLSTGALVTPTYTVSGVKPTTILAGTAIPTDPFLSAA